MTKGFFIVLFQVFLIVAASATIALIFVKEQFFSELLNCFTPEFISSIALILQAIAWPIVILIAINLLKNNITALTNYITNGGKITLNKHGLSIEGKTQKSEENIKSVSEADELSTKKASSNTTVDDEEIDPNEAFQRVLREQPLLEQYLEYLEPHFKEGTKKFKLREVDFLKAKATDFYLYWRFEQTYSAIFKSQIDALKRMASQGGKAALIEIKFYYDNAQTAYPAVYESYSFDEWLSYLESQFLIIRDGDQISLSREGHGLLNYIEDHKKHFTKYH